MTNISPHQILYYAWCLTHKKAIDDDSKFTGVLSEAKVDMNPHQVEAALFAFNSPLSKGAVLADEVGLGKTIEAGIILSQTWAENARRIIIVAPASLRNQWSIELADKFYLPSLILERNSYNELKNNKLTLNDVKDQIFICSYNFAQNHASEIDNVDWDLVVIDEAHKLRNVYKKGNVMASAIKKLFNPYKKILLTATPLQNNLKELYGLVSIIDDGFFSGLETFTEQYNEITTRDSAKFGELKGRMKHMIHRTLRSDVQEYVNYTKRTSIVQEFALSSNELKLYNDLDEYLSRPGIYGIPEIVKHLLSLIIRKIMASSSYALSFTLQRIIDRLEELKLTGMYSLPSSQIIFDYESEMEDDEADCIETLDSISADDIAAEIAELKNYKRRALDIEIESKAISLIDAINVGFSKMAKIGAEKKALIFTESRKTQEYLYELLERKGYKGKIATFNGVNKGEETSLIYKTWLRAHKNTSRVSGNPTIDKKQSIVDFFKDEAEILIATEACAEGVNLQFCSLVINYDMPWNPQRIEQRIGRCHRYGQKYDVVVINFVNQSNQADQRVYELLSQKFHLFEGVFGCSDEVLGALESGVDFERRLASIYHNCRTEQEINSAFDDLQQELDQIIQERIKQTKRSLIEHFDEDVVNKLRVRGERDTLNVNTYKKHFWRVATSILKNHISNINNDEFTFTLLSAPELGIPLGKYILNKENGECHQLRLGHPLGEYIIRTAQSTKLTESLLTFNLSGYLYKSMLLESYKGCSGYLYAYCVKSTNQYDNKEDMIICAIDSRGVELPTEFGEKLLELAICNSQNCKIDNVVNDQITTIFNARLEEYGKQLGIHASKHISREIDKYEAWEEDQISPIQNEVIALRREVELLKRKSRKEINPEGRLELLESRKLAERQLRKKEVEFYTLKDTCSDKIDDMTLRLRAAMQNTITVDTMFRIAWSIM